MYSEVFLEDSFHVRKLVNLLDGVKSSASVGRAENTLDLVSKTLLSVSVYWT